MVTALAKAASATARAGGETPELKLAVMPKCSRCAGASALAALGAQARLPHKAAVALAVVLLVVAHDALVLLGSRMLRRQLPRRCLADFLAAQAHVVFGLAGGLQVFQAEWGAGPYALAPTPLSDDLLTIVRKRRVEFRASLILAPTVRTYDVGQQELSLAGVRPARASCGGLTNVAH